MDIAKVIYESTLYIHRMYAEPIAVADIAAQSYLSPSYFSFLFRTITGYTVKNYLNRYRLHCAALDLLGSDKPIVDVAYSTGFSSQQGFTKNFSQVVGISPAQFRSRRPAFEPFPPQNLWSQIWKESSMELMDCFKNVRFMHKDAFFVAGLEVDIHYNTGDGTAPIGGLWDTWIAENYKHTIPDQVSPGVVYGMTHSETADNRAKYLVGVEVSTLDNLPVGLVERKFEGSEMAVFDTTLEIIFTGNFWRTFYAKWLPESGYTLHEEHNDLLDAFRKYPAIEVYGADWKNEQSMMQAYAPVVKKV